jgi:CzcA family heavy metal efflux pump
MLRGLITFCLTYRVVVLLLAAGLLVWGAIAARQAPWDVFPEFAPPQLVIQTEAPGLSTEEAEQLITVPIESALNGVQGLETLRSSSVPGLSVVTAVFEEGTNILEARQLVAERLTGAKAMLPEIAEAPRMEPLKSSLSKLAMIGITSENLSPRDLRTLVDWTLKRRLLAVRGVAQVEVFGGEVKQYQILVKPDRLRQYQVSLDEVVAAAQHATGFGGAGYVETENQRLPVRQETRIESPADLAAAPIAVRDGATLTLGHVADVEIGSAKKAGDAMIDGREGVLLIVHRQPSANTLEVTQELDAALDELQSGLPSGVVMHRNLFRQATFIEHAIGNLNTAILIGCGLVAVILVAFLFQWRTVAINLTAIPLSLLGAMLVLRGFGASLNAMTLGGLAIALGAVVDDAIVDVENVLRRLQENHQRPQPASAFHVVLEASLEVRSAIVHASFIVILVFLPVFFLPGLAGTLFRPMGQAYVAAILVSLLVALTVTPAMCFVLLRRIRGRHADPPTLRAVKWLYGKTLPLSLRFSRLTVVVAAVLLIASLAVIPWLGGEFLPEFREVSFVVAMPGKPDMSLAETMRAGQLVADSLKQIDGVVSVVQQAGRAELSEDTWGPNVSEFWVVLDQAKIEPALAKMRDSLESFPGYEFQIQDNLRERIDEVLTGVTTDIVIRVFGPDLAELRTQATRIASAIRNVDGVEDLRVEQQVDIPQIEVLLQPREASRYGLSVAELNSNIQTLLRGRTVGQVYERDRVFDVVVIADPSLCSDPAQLGELLVDSPTHEKLPLRAVANIGLSDSPNVINRDGGSRRILVTANAIGRDVVGVMHDIQARLDGRTLRLPPEYHLEFGGEYQARQSAQRRLLSLGAAALVGIFILLYLDFQSARLSLLMMLSVPLACVGGIAAVLVTGGDVSLGSLVGFVTVFGIAVRNGILLVSHYTHLREVEGMEFGRALIIRGATERLAPILMTALATGLALLPLALLGNRPGHEIEHPMAVVILGGLISSTFLSLVLLPVLYQWVGRPPRSE